MPGELPRTAYVRSGEAHIAYQVFGDHAHDLLVIPGGVTHLELRWEEPDLAPAFRRLARFARVIVVDKRGVGLSDRTAVLPSFGEQVEDLVAVLDAVESTRPTVIGHQDGAMLACEFAAAHPDGSHR